MARFIELNANSDYMMYFALTIDLIMNSVDDKLDSAIDYYDKFSMVYDIFSSRRYYHKPRSYSIGEMNLEEGQFVLNIPCGTGQNFEYFQQYMHNSGQIVGVDLSNGMLSKAKRKIEKNNWTNIEVYIGDAQAINNSWIKNKFGEATKFDSILCDLGLSGFPNWELIIDNLISMLRPGGKLVIMDWYIEKWSVRGEFIKWVGKGEVNRPLWQYLEERVINFKLNDSFKKGEMFVASGNKK